ncbi:MAG TPA: histidine phosphatase family protein [Tissierellia bacterium]|nr:histidine phosphatase family protein [Tissierellia bacterium]
MTKIYLARHGESQWNILKMIQGQKDVPLTEKGINQAKLLGKRLKGEKIKKIYSSDLLRAYETAKIVGEIINVEVIALKEFREINFGIWEGMSNDELYKYYEEEYELWLRNPEKLILEGAETLYDLQKRAISGINKIINTKDSSINNILIVSHSATIKAIILGLLDMDISHYKNLALDNVSLSIIEFRKYNNVLKLFNDTSHVKER